MKGVCFPRVDIPTPMPFLRISSVLQLYNHTTFTKFAFIESNNPVVCSLPNDATL